MRRFVVLSALWMATASCTSSPPADATGQEIYVQLCASCHGEDLGGGLGPSLGPGSNSAGQSDEFLELTTMRGRGRMPSFGSNLSAEQLDRLVGFIRENQR